MSLRLRLALWYGGLTGLIIVLTSLLGYVTHSRVHYDDFDRILAVAAEHLADEYATSPPQNRDAVLAASVAPGLATRVYDARGQVVAGSPNAGLIPTIDPRTMLAQPAGVPYDPIVALAPPLVERAEGRGTFGLADERADGRWRLYLLPIARSDQLLLAAAPLHDVDKSVSAFRGLVPLLALGGAASAFIFSGLLAGRALRPVAVVTETAGTIARSRGFSKRVPAGGSPDELGRLESTFNEMLDSLEQAYLAQQRFVADASHELRAPLTAIQANLELLERRPELAPSDRQEAILEAGREARRLVRLVADLLALARADAGVELRRQPVELDRILLDALSEARHFTQGQRFEVEVLEPTSVDGDPDRLKQLFLILLDNAMKYAPDAAVAVSLRRDGSTAEVAVRDAGPGIAANDLPHVFERFYRADPGRSRDPGGTGLGLPIARWIAEQHGGKVELASEVRRGTTATVRLPAQPASI
jgi:two-component system, OmpR family, sensor kinase